MSRLVVALIAWLAFAPSAFAVWEGLTSGNAPEPFLIGVMESSWIAHCEAALEEPTADGCYITGQVQGGTYYECPNAGTACWAWPLSDGNPYYGEDLPPPEPPASAASAGGSVADWQKLHGLLQACIGLAWLGFGFLGHSMGRKS